MGRGDCLVKTQDFAKFNNDVFSLTSVRRHKTNLGVLPSTSLKVMASDGCILDGPKVSKKRSLIVVLWGRKQQLLYCLERRFY